MFLSIVIPTWNDEKFLNECLDSCLDQGLSDREYEIICVDDGSTDRTPEILREYCDKYTNISVISKQHGVGSGRMIGMAAARADYIWFVDHDDFLAPHALDDLRQAALEHADYDRIRFPCYEFVNTLTDEERRLLHTGGLQMNFVNTPLDHYVWSSIFKLSFLRENHISSDPQRIHEAAVFWGIEDFMLWAKDWVLNYEFKDKDGRTYFMTGRPLYYYRLNMLSETRSSLPEHKERRVRLRYNMGLYRAWLAWTQKQKYLAERAEFGRASAKTTEKLMALLRDAVTYMRLQPLKQLLRGIRQMKEKDIFLSKRPEEDTLSFRKYWKNLSKTEKFLPHVLAIYFCYSKIGVDLYLFLYIPFRILANNKLWVKWRKATLRKRLVGRGSRKGSA